jgi:regulator of sigma E protease
MSGILIFLLVLSVLVFVHELGHFVAAKACGIFVDRFSIGMPPRIFGIKVGETDYCIGALPIGGFVKMAGQEDAPLSDEERDRDYGHVPPDRWFNNKPVWQRLIVLIGGPAMNVVLAFVVYAFLAGWGEEVRVSELEARVGQVSEGMPAATAPLYAMDDSTGAVNTETAPDATGWKTGDLLVSFDREPIHSPRDVAIAAALGGEDAEYRFVIEREQADGSKQLYLSPISPKFMDEEAEFPQFGISFLQGAEVDYVVPGNPGESAGLKQGDLIARLNGEPVGQRTFIDQVENTAPGDTLHLTIERDGETLERSLEPITTGRIKGISFGPPYDLDSGENADATPEVMFAEDEVTANVGIQRKDRVVKVNGEKATMARLRELERSNPDGTLTLDVERPAILFGLLQQAENKTFEVPVTSVRQVGVQLTEPRVFHQVPASEVIPKAWYECKKAVMMTVNTVAALVTRDVSPDQLGGPVMIYQITTDAAKVGFTWLLRIMAFISINLAVFNLLPIPILDGGQIVLNVGEAVRRKPFSIKFIERYQQVGFVFVMSLMLFVTWNDIWRLVERVMP